MSLNRCWLSAFLITPIVIQMLSPEAHAQSASQPIAISRTAAVAAAVARGSRLMLATTDTALARAQVVAAGARPSPAISASYTESTPQYHAALDIPLEYPGRRSLRLDAARAGLGAARYRYQFERATVAFAAETLYTTAQARTAHVTLSHANAESADSLFRIAAMRRDAGDASDLDVELASLYAGEQHNAAAIDSLEWTESLLTLQFAMGMDADAVRISIRDSLGESALLEAGAGLSSGSAGTGGGKGEPLMLTVASATASLRAAEFNTRLERRSRWTTPSISAGFETRDPSGTGNRILPTLGLLLPLPFFNWNRGPIAVANAERDRARASLGIARQESQLVIAQSMRSRELAAARAARGAALVSSANRVADMSMTAFREGAASLASVLEAQRTARDLLRAHIDDIARAGIATATVRLLTLTASPDRIP